jgi:signal transduction histidine kinase
VPLLLAPCIVAGIVSLLLRRHRATGLERRQLDVVAFGALVTIAIGLLAPFTPSPYYLVVVAVALAPYPLALGVAATRHRLWELDLVLRRSVVYGVVTVAAVAVYVVSIALLGGALGARTGAPLVATAVVAVGAVPLFLRVQRSVDRRLYGDRSDPSAAVRRLADRWETGERPPAATSTLAAMAEDVATGLRLPHVRIVTASGLEGSAGTAGQPVTRVPLRRGGLVLGELVASSREPGRALSRRDVSALHELAGYVAVVVHNLDLSSDLQRSRERVVSAREEERRRLRRELHDGLGPELAAIALQLETVRDLADADADHSPAAALAESLRAQVRSVVADVRRIVDDLRPALLDDIGLEGALRQQAARLGTGQLSIDVHVDALPPLSAAIELAALRIAGEAMTNAVRHSGGSHCRVEVGVEDGLVEVLVADDGQGFVPSPHGGVGIGSMRERAQEVGGSCTVESGPARGTVVHALIPLPMEDGS